MVTAVEPRSELELDEPDCDDPELELELELELDELEPDEYVDSVSLVQELC